jgi:uncharacterized protein YbjT (DUF2867 family)
VKVLVFGATGMVGQGALRECLLDSRVEEVTTVVRAPTGQTHPKLREIVHRDLQDLSAIEDRLAGHDACFFCVGVTSAGLGEAEYRRVTCDIALAAAQALLRRSPGLTFVFVSGAGADSTEQGRVMWARVKGATENALLRLPFKAVYVFRPAVIQPRHGIRSRTGWYNAIYAVTWPLVPVIRLLAPRYVTTTEDVGRAMIEVAAHGAPRRVLENGDINAAARRGAGPAA